MRTTGRLVGTLCLAAMSCLGDSTSALAGEPASRCRSLNYQAGPGITILHIETDEPRSELQYELWSHPGSSRPENEFGWTREAKSDYPDVVLIGADAGRRWFAVLIKRHGNLVDTWLDNGACLTLINVLPMR